MGHVPRLFVMKYELQLLGYWDKIYEVESIIKESRDLCDKYGYFSLTVTMIRYNSNCQRKLSIWIHPDVKAKRPLHPI